jgi:hypothetical protein
VRIREEPVDIADCGLRIADLTAKNAQNTEKEILFALGLLRLFEANHPKSLSMNKLHHIANFRNQAQSSLIKANRVIFPAMNPTECWSVGVLRLPITPSLHHSTSQSRWIKPN